MRDVVRELTTSHDVASLLADLRARLPALEEAHNRALANHERAVQAWRIDMKAWIQADLLMRLSSFAPNIERASYSLREFGFDPTDLLGGCPKAPTPPDGTELRHVRAAIRQLERTTSKVIRLTTAELNALLPEPPCLSTLDLPAPAPSAPVSRTAKQRHARGRK